MVDSIYYAGSSTFRLIKDNQKLRTVKITFRDHDFMLDDAVKNSTWFSQYDIENSTNIHQ